MIRIALLLACFFSGCAHQQRPYQVDDLKKFPPPTLEIPRDKDIPTIEPSPGPPQDAPSVFDKGGEMRIPGMMADAETLLNHCIGNFLDPMQDVHCAYVLTEVVHQCREAEVAATDRGQTINPKLATICNNPLIIRVGKDLLRSTQPRR